MRISSKTVATVDRFLRIAGAIAIIAIAVVVVFGTLRDRNQDKNAREVACAVALWNGEIVDYFDGTRMRLDQRIGTPEQVSTDLEARAELTALLDASNALADTIGGSCGDAYAEKQENPRTR